MKNIINFGLLISLLLGCVGTDIQGEQDEVLRITESSSTLRETETFQFKSEYIDGLAQSAAVAVSWNSSNSSIVAINDEGLATAIGVGIAELSVHFESLSDVFSVEVLPSKEAITISNFVNIIDVGNSMEFEAVYLDFNGQATVPDDKVWSSSDPSIISVKGIAEGKGTVTAHTAGTVMITVQAGNVMNSVIVESTAEIIMIPEEVRITKFTSTMNVGDDFTFEAIYFNTSGLPDESVQITWSSSDNSVISISSNGIATSEMAGMSTIIASSGSVMNNVTVESVTAQSQERTVTLQGVSGYDISGMGTLKIVNGSVTLELEGVKLDGPGPYFYLSNSSNNVNNGLNLGKSTAGSVNINVSSVNSEVTLNQYDYVAVWCEPFGIMLGIGELSQ